MKLKVGKGTIEAQDDDDGHLTVALSHQDGTQVVCCQADIAANETEWSDRFTTEGIEGKYAKETVNPIMNKPVSIQDTSMPLSTPEEVLRMFLTPWAYRVRSEGAWVASGNVAFIKQKMLECGHPDFPVYKAGGGCQGRVY